VILRRSRALLDLAGIILDLLFCRPLDQARGVELMSERQGAVFARKHRMLLAARAMTVMARVAAAEYPSPT